MEIRNISKREFKKIIKSTGGYYIYEDNGRLIKFDKVFTSDIVKFGDLYSHSREIEPQQIEWLSGLNRDIKNSDLPIGTVNYNGTAVGVIYPHYFSGYNSFERVRNEYSILFLQNIKRAIENNIELMKNGIYNNDFIFKNILYKSEEVKLIDLDGKHIKRKMDSNPSNVYAYFISNVKKALFLKLVSIYGVEEAKRIMIELKYLFPDLSSYDEYTPLKIIDGIEKTKVLK